MPFWAVTVLEAVVCVCVIVLGIVFSNHNESSRRKAKF